MQVRFLPGVSSIPKAQSPASCVLRSAPPRVREHVRSAADPRAPRRRRSAALRPGALDVAPVHAPPPVVDVGDPRNAVLHRARAVGADATRLRPLRLAGLGTPDALRLARHQRRTLVEAAALPADGAVRARRPLPALPVDGRLGGRVAGRRGVRGADRLPADGRPARASLRRDRGGGVRRGCAARDPGLLALRPQRSVGPDDRHAVPGRDRLPPLAAPPLGVRARRPGGARPPRGLAVPRPVHDLGLADDPFDEVDDRLRPAADRAALVRDPGAHRAESVRRGHQRARIGPAPAREQGARHAQSLPGHARGSARGRCTGGGRDRGLSGAIARRSRSPAPSWRG